jgi:hypothetical protein
MTNHKFATGVMKGCKREMGKKERKDKINC